MNKMEINPLTDLDYPYGKIKFIHTDGTTHTFFTSVNQLTNTRLSGFDGDAPTIGHTVLECKKIFKAIHNNSKQVLQYIGSQHFQKYELDNEGGVRSK